MELNPHTVVWEYTLKCNSKCLHCGSDAFSARPNELTTEEALDLVEQIAKLDFERIILAGGEPTLRTDWVKTAEKAREEGLEVGMISNLLRWDQRIIDAVSNLGFYSIGFSVDGNEELHDFLRGAKNSHQKIFSTVKELKKRKQYLCAVTTVNNENIAQLSDIQRRLMVYGVDAWQIQAVMPMGRAGRNIQLSEEQHYQVGQFIAEAVGYPRIKITHGDCLGYYGQLSKDIGLDWQGCWAGIRGLGIESDGTIKGCLSMQSDLAREGNVRERKLAEIWTDTRLFLYNRDYKSLNLGELCLDCEKESLCRGGCQAQSLAHSNQFHNSPYCFLRYEKGGKNG